MIRILAIVGLVAGSAAADTIWTYADQDQNGDMSSLGSGYAATIYDSGIRGGTSGTRYFNIEGRNNGDFASWGAVRFDLTELYAALDAAEPNGWTITGVEVVFEQSNASFSNSGGPLDVFYSADDATDINPETNAGGLGGFGTVHGANHMYGGQLGATTLAGSFNYVETSNGFQEGTDISIQAILDDINNTADSALTLVVDSGDVAVAATYRGEDSPYQGINAPALAVTYIPAPGAVALLGLGGLIASRRRRA